MIFIPKNKKIKRTINKSEIERVIIFEKKIFDTYNKGLIKYPVHLSKGNEKQLLKIFQYIGKNDWLFSSWRNHAHALLHGMSEKKLYDQIINGKSMYVSCNKRKIFCSSIAGGIIPIALGVALAIKKRKEKNKVWLFVGDMTSKMGVFHETYHYSRNFNLPLEIVIEDNGASVYTDTKKTWNISKLDYPKDVFYYDFKMEYPHHGTGKWVSF